MQKNAKKKMQKNANTYEDCQASTRLFRYQTFGTNRTILNQTKVFQTERSVFERLLYLLIIFSHQIIYPGYFKQFRLT